MAVTIQNLKEMIGGLSTVPDSVLQSALDDALEIVKLDGVGETHSQYDRLVRYKAGHLLYQMGYSRQGLVASEAVADVNTSYAMTALKPGETPFLVQYRSLLMKIKGFGNRIVKSL